MYYILKFSKLLLLSVLILKDIRCKEEYAVNEISDDTICFIHYNDISDL